MIDVRISKNGIERYEITGTPADVVAEFGIMINQYCSAVKKMLPADSPWPARALHGPYCAGKPGVETG